MSARKIITIKLSYRRVLLLMDLHNDYNRVFVPKITDDHGVLISAHLRAFCTLLADMAAKEQKKYTLKLDELQTLAFCQMWSYAEIKGDVPKLTVLQEVLAEIDKQRKNNLPHNKQPHEKIKGIPASQRAQHEPLQAEPAGTGAGAAATG